MSRRKPFEYDPLSLRYRYAESGRLVPERVARAEVRRLSYGVRDELRQLTIQYKNGEITLQEWYDGMRVRMKDSYRNAVDLARGGRSVPFTPYEKGQFGAMMKKQYGYLNRLAKGLQDGTVTPDGRLVARAGMYGETTNTIYENWKKLEAKKAGYTEERRRLQPAEHCEDCVAEADKGWQPIGSLLPIGQSQCRSHCHCFFEYRNRENTHGKRSGARSLAGSDLNQ